MNDLFYHLTNYHDPNSLCGTWDIYAIYFHLIRKLLANNNPSYYR